MKFTFKPSPNYRSAQSTTGIMRDLTMCLCAVTIFSVIYYCAVWGANYGLRVVLLTVVAVVSAMLTDVVWCKATKKDIKTGVRSSYSWVTAIIMVLISSIDTAYYAMAIATILAIVFGKLVFGGFGQNIFNPAAFGEAIIMQSFAATKVADFATSATPTSVMNSYGWMASADTFSGSIVSKFGGLGNMLVGMYPSTIGSTCAILILLCGVFLVWRKDIDWQTPVFYIGSVFIMTALIGAIHGAGLWYPAFQVLAGGVMFGGIFMLTDPVTSPVSIPGRIVFAVGAAALTVIIRTKSNLADGVLFSILLMNMLTPAIDKLFDGNQIKDAKKFMRNTCVISAVLLACTVAFGTQLEAKTPTAASDSSASAGDSEVAAATLSADFTANEATCEEESNDGTTAVYACSAKGFGLINNMGSDYSMNKVKVTVTLGEPNTVESVELISFGDTEGIGDLAVADDVLAGYAGKTLEDEVDGVSGATFTKTSLDSMVSAALNGGSAAEGNATETTTETTAPSGFAMSDTLDLNAVCEETSNDGTTAVYACAADGFHAVSEAGPQNKAEVTINLADQSVVSVNVTGFNDTEGLGDKATSDDELAQYEGVTLESSVDGTSSATFTTKSIIAMLQTALNAAAGN